jgi:hypothetical protein
MGLLDAHVRDNRVVAGDINNCDKLGLSIGITSSFSIVFWEMLWRGESPFNDENSYSVMEKVLRQGLRPRLPEDWSFPLCQLLQECWDADPQNRPSFTEVGCICVIIFNIINLLIVRSDLVYQIITTLIEGDGSAAKRGADGIARGLWCRA